MAFLLRRYRRYNLMADPLRLETGIASREAVVGRYRNGPTWIVTEVEAQGFRDGEGAPVL